MINKRLIVLTLALCSAPALEAAQTPPRPAPHAPMATAQLPTTTLAGCLYREDQVPERKPNVAERAGVLEDYILADATMPGVKPGTATSSTSQLPAVGNMYKVEKIPDEKLKALVGKRVEVTGRIDPEGPGVPGTPRPDRGPGPDDINLPEFEATSIREVPGSCPASPAPRKQG